MKSLGTAAVLLACLWTSTLRGADERRVRLTWDAHKMQELDRDLNALYATFTEPSTKSNYEERAKLVDKLVESRLTPVDMRDLAADADQVPAEAKDRNTLQAI